MRGANTQFKPTKTILSFCPEALKFALESDILLKGEQLDINLFSAEADAWAHNVMRRDKFTCEENASVPCGLASG